MDEVTSPPPVEHLDRSIAGDRVATPKQEPRRDAPARMMDPPSADVGRSGTPEPVSAAPAAPSSMPVFDVDRILNTLQSGDIIFTNPSTIRYGTSIILTVTLYPPNMGNVPEAGVGKIKDTLLVSNKMEAILTGVGFMIEELSQGKQAVSGYRPTEWKWNVTPIRHGIQSLHLSVLAHITVESTETPYVIQSYDRQIDVQITTGQLIWNFINDHLEFVIGALLIPLMGFLYNIIRKKRGKNE